MDVKPIRRVWRGVQFDSQLEADWAATLTAWGMEYVYHPGAMVLATGEVWEPDFQLDGDVLLEVKGWHNDRIEKAWAASAMGFKVIIGRAGLVPRGSDVEKAGALWEPEWWVVANVGSKLRFIDSRASAPAGACYSADAAVRGGLGGIRWFKAVGDDRAA